MSDLLTWLRAQWDRAAAIALLVIGAVLVIAGYVGISGANELDDQLSYFASGGIGGLFCLGLGASLLVSANLGDEWRKLHDLTQAVRGARSAAETEAADAVEIDARVPDDDRRPEARATALRAQA